MTALIIDVAEDVTAKLGALKASGIRTIFGYLSSINPNGGKCLTPSRVRAIAAAGMRVGLVHEGWGGVGGKGISAADGTRDGRYCRVRARVLGAPKGACVYFACDQDFTLQQIRTLVLPYFAAIRAAFADRFYRVGVYGSGAVCSAVIAAGAADLSWLAQSRGWLGYSAWLAKANLVQGPAEILTGLDVDTDAAQATSAITSRCSLKTRSKQTWPRRPNTSPSPAPFSKSSTARSQPRCPAGRKA